MNKYFIWSLVILANFLWGATFVAISYLDKSLSSLEATILRFIVASIFLVLIHLFFKEKTTRKLEFKIKLKLIFLGLIGIAAFNYILFVGLKMTSAVNGSLIMATEPFFVIILSSIILKTKITIYQLIGFFISIIGIFLLITNGNIYRLKFNYGDVLILISCICAGLYIVLIKKLVPHVPSMQLSKWSIISSTIIMLILYQIFFANIIDIKLSFKSILLLFYLGAFGTVLAYYLWTIGIQKLGPEKIAITANLIPLFTVVISFILGNHITNIQIIGMLIILIGLFIGTIITKKHNDF